MFGKKGNDFVFKMGDSMSEPISLTAEEALMLFEAKETELPYETSKGFDKIYQNVKAHLFRNVQNDKNEKERLNAMAKIKVIRQVGVISGDYLHDLMSVIESDALSGFELRYINQLTSKEYSKLPKEIEQEYLNRIITTVGRVDEGDEALILAEEILN
jgi:hypothetical protein